MAVWSTRRRPTDLLMCTRPWWPPTGDLVSQAGSPQGQPLSQPRRPWATAYDLLERDVKNSMIGHESVRRAIYLRIAFAPPPEWANVQSTIRTDYPSLVPIIGTRLWQIGVASVLGVGISNLAETPDISICRSGGEHCDPRY